MQIETPSIYTGQHLDYMWWLSQATGEAFALSHNKGRHTGVIVAASVDDVVDNITDGAVAAVDSVVVVINIATSYDGEDEKETKG